MEKSSMHLMGTNNFMIKSEMKMGVEGGKI
jgi:hypothetical protein